MQWYIINSTPYSINFLLSKYWKLLLIVGGFNLIGEPFISQVSKKFSGFAVQCPVDDIQEERGLLNILQIDIVDNPNICEAVILCVFNVQNPVDNFTLSHWKLQINFYKWYIYKFYFFQFHSVVLSVNTKIIWLMYRLWGFVLVTIIFVIFYFYISVQSI